MFHTFSVTTKDKKWAVFLINLKLLINALFFLGTIGRYSECCIIIITQNLNFKLKFKKFIRTSMRGVSTAFKQHFWII